MVRSLLLACGLSTLTGCVLQHDPNEDDFNHPRLFALLSDAAEDPVLPSPKDVTAEVREEEIERARNLGITPDTLALSEAVSLDRYLEAQQVGADVQVLGLEDSREGRGRPRGPLYDQETLLSIKLGTLGARVAERREDLKKQVDAGQLKTYVVQPGDSLSRIAHNIMGAMQRWKELADLNGIPYDGLIFVGETLVYATESIPIQTALQN